MLYQNDYRYIGDLQQVTDMNPDLHRVDGWIECEIILERIGITPEHEDWNFFLWQPLLVGIANGDYTRICVIQGNTPYDISAPVYELVLE